MLFSLVLVNTAGAWVNRKKGNGLPHPNRFFWLTPPAHCHHVDTKLPLGHVVGGMEVSICESFYVPVPKIAQQGRTITALGTGKMALLSWL